MTHPFEKAFTPETEAIELEGVTFHVELPGQTHKRFHRAVMGETFTFNNETGELVRKELTAVDMVEIQIRAFVQSCIKRVDGWEGYTVDKLLALPDACETLWDMAREIADAKQREAEETVKKSVAISDGAKPGQKRESSIKPLKQAAD